MASPQTTIADAFERLRRSISDEDAHKFASTRLEDVWTAVQEIDNSQRKRLCAQNLRRIEPFLRGIGKFAATLEVLCNGTPFLPYAWAPIKFMVQIASQYRDVFEALLSAYADIGAALPRFDRYEGVFKDNKEFQNVLASTYSNILDFHEKAYNFFKRKGWHILFLSLWRDFGSRFSGIIESLKSQRDFVDQEAASLHIVEAKDSRAKLQSEILQRQKLSQDAIERTERDAKIAQLQHSVTWLAVDDKIQETELERHSYRRHDETCKWVTSEKHMKAWVKNDTKSSLLWINGKPGSGKSVICSYLVEAFRSTPGLTTCYFFCNSKDSVNVCAQILRTIALQLLRASLDLASLIANQFVYRGASCGMAQLRELVPQLLQATTNTRIIIDGVDECSKDAQRAVLKEIHALCIGPEISSKVLISSRKEVEIREKLLGKPHISLDGRKEVELDIQMYVKYKIRQLQTSDTQLLDRIESILTEKANGMFLWVHLVVEELRYCYSEAELEEKAMSLPRGLREAYGRILDRIMDDQYTRTMAIKILEWMACSYRTLKSYEILDGIAFRPGCTTLNVRTKVNKAALDHCRPLIEEGPSSTIDFVHFSAKEYILEGQYQDEKPFIHLQQAYFDIVFSCISYLNTCLPLLSPNGTDDERVIAVVQGLHGLHLYANEFWYRHLLAYAGCCTKDQIPFPTELLNQLSSLLRFYKDQMTPVRLLANPIQVSGLEVLNQDPRVRELVSSVISFKERLKKDDSNYQNPEDTSLALYTSDPTHFSTARHYYRLTTEYLFDERARVEISGIDPNTLRKFRHIYGASAFVCRYIHCSFSTDGFGTPLERSNHEAQHQRKYRCEYTTCVSFATGFSTRAQLNRHNERYHPTISNGSSLVDAMKALKVGDPFVQRSVNTGNSSPDFSLYGRKPTQQRSGSRPNRDSSVKSSPLTTNNTTYNVQKHLSQSNNKAIYRGSSLHEIDMNTENMRLSLPVNSTLATDKMYNDRRESNSLKSTTPHSQINFQEVLKFGPQNGYMQQPLQRWAAEPEKMLFTSSSLDSAEAYYFPDHQNFQDPSLRDNLKTNFSGSPCDPSVSAEQVISALDADVRRLLDYFISDTLPIIFPLIETNKRDHLLQALHTNKYYLNCCLSIAAQHSKASMSIQGDNVDSNIMRFRCQTISELSEGLHTKKGTPEILDACLAMISFQRSVGGVADKFPDIPWHKHFQAVISLVQKLELPRIVTEESQGVIKQAPFSMTLTSWIDILGSTMAGRAPTFCHTYREKHMSTLNSSLGLRELMGCEDRIMYHISDIACLEALKEDGLDEITLCQHVHSLDDQISLTEVDSTVLQVPFDRDGILSFKKLSEIISAAFCVAARLYLLSLLPNASPRSNRCIELVKDLTSVLECIPLGPAGYDRSLVWVYLIGGSVSTIDSWFRDVFNRRMMELGHLADFGSLGCVVRLLHEVWAHVDDCIDAHIEPDCFSWRGIMQKNGWIY